MAAFDRTESFGLKAPPRIRVEKPCVDIERTLAILLDYFDEHANGELLGQTLAIHTALQPRLYQATGVPFELTIGWTELAGQPTFRHHDEVIHRFMTDKRVAWQRVGLPFHLWLTSPAFEVLDATFAMNNGWASNREECARLLIYKPPAATGDPVYHPTLVGEDFFRQTGLMIDFDGKWGTGPG